MYDIKLVENVFHEAELLVMTRDHYEKLKRLMDDKLAGRMIKFFKQVESLRLNEQGDAVAEALFKRYTMARTMLDSSVRQMSFHVEVRDKGVLATVHNLDITTAHELFQDKDRAIELLTWLLDNRQYWSATIEPRRLEDWKALEACIEDIERNAENLRQQFEAVGIKLNSCPNLKARLKDNKELFYAPNEKTRVTGMGYVFLAAKNLEIILHGFKFQKRCQAEKISKSEWRAF